MNLVSTSVPSNAQHLSDSGTIQKFPLGISQKTSETASKIKVILDCSLKIYIGLSSRKSQLVTVQSEIKITLAVLNREIWFTELGPWGIEQLGENKGCQGPQSSG